jgi:predicted lysophospholipase L1 biosynthesis ABC-type transport system permease subunit
VFESLRRFGFPLRLVAARFRVGGKRLLLVAAGVIAGAAVLAAVLAGRLVMQDRALAQATAGLAPGDREVAVAWSGATNDFPRLNRLVVPRVQEITGQRPAAAMLFREASIQQRLVNLRAADDLGRYVRLVSGRLPSPCHPSHCEVLRLQGEGPIPSTRHLKLIEVGRAVLKPDAPFGPFVLPAPPTEMVAQAVRYHTPQPSPIVIANGVAGLSDNTELQTFYRSYAWFVPIRGGDVHPWEVAAFRSKVQRLTAEIEASSDEFQVTAPTDALATAASSSTAAARRLLLLGGEGAALLLAFTILAAAAMRRDVTDARRRLVWFGARRWQVELHTLAESLSLATAGTVVGWAVGGAAAAVVASRAGSPVADVVRHALLSPGGLLAAAGVAAVAGLLLYATVRAPSLHLGRAGVTPLDVAALGAIAVVLVGWARGSVDSQQLTGGSGTSAFLLLVPALIVFAGAVCAARLLGPTLRALGRAGRRGPIALRLAAASLARNPGHAAIAATFLVASLGLALFAVTYRSTLLRGQEDEASFAVPASFVLSEDLSQLVPVLHGAPPDRYPGTTTSVLRLSGNVPSGTTFSFLGLPADRVTSVGGWRPDFASKPLQTLAAAITPKRNVALHTTSLPAGRQFSLPVRAKGDDVGVRAIFRSRLGDYEAVALGHTNGSRVTLLHGRIPFIGATLAQLRLDILNQDRLSANGGLGLQPSAKGELSFGAARVNGKLVHTPFASWVGSGGVSGSAARLGYVLTSDQNGVFRPTQPTDGVPLPVLATPHVIAAAGPHGIIPLQVEGEQIAARIVGTIRRFPSVDGDAVVADRTDAATILDTRFPGLGTTDELWVTVPAADEASAATTLSHAPFTQLTLRSRADTLSELRADPLARGALLTLAGTAAVALLLALVGLLLSVVGDVRDDRGELFDLEAQGASPATIRAHLRLRALLVASFGVVGGLVLGAILTSLVIALVSVTAAAARPEPPLRLVLDVPLLLLATVLYVFVAALLVGAATSLRGRAPQRAAEALT